MIGSLENTTTLGIKKLREVFSKSDSMSSHQVRTQGCFLSGRKGDQVSEVALVMLL